jgi:hypothetical protein
MHVTIDRLVISGLDPAARHAFVAALKTELTNTLTDPSQPAEWANYRRTPVLVSVALPSIPVSAEPAISAVT